MGTGDRGPPDVRALYESYGRAVYRRCQYFLRNDDEARDAMHDVFVKVVERYDDFKGDASPLTWLVRISSNHCLNILRSRRARWRGRYEESAKIEASGRLDAIDRLERLEVVRAVLNKAERKSQEAAVYYFVDEMNQEDGARAAGCSVPTFRKRVRAFVKSARKLIRTLELDLAFPEDDL